jgi:hypothetical protein
VENNKPISFNIHDTGGKIKKIVIGELSCLVLRSELREGGSELVWKRLEEPVLGQVQVLKRDHHPDGGWQAADVVVLQVQAHQVGPVGVQDIPRQG